MQVFGAFLETLCNNKCDDGESVKRQTIVNRNQFVGCSFAYLLNSGRESEYVRFYLAMLEGSGFGMFRADRLYSHIKTGGVLAISLAYKAASLLTGITGFDVGKPRNWGMWGLLLHCIQLYTNKALFFLKHCMEPNVQLQ